MNTKWKQISFERYQQLVGGMSEIEIILNNIVSKSIKPEVHYRGCFELGIVGGMNKADENAKHTIEPDNYEYFENDGYEYVIMGSEKTISAMEEVIKNNI